MDVYLKASSWREFCGSGTGYHWGDAILNIDNSSGFFKKAQVIEIKRENGVGGSWYVKVNNNNVSAGNIINLAKGTITMRIYTGSDEYSENGVYGRVRLFTS